MRNELKLSLTILFAALLGGVPASSVAQSCPFHEDDEGVDKMSNRMAHRWITNLGEALENNPEGTYCHDVLSAAHFGAQEARITCGIFWVEHLFARA